MRILLIHPPFLRLYKSSIQQIPLGYLYIASLLSKKNYDVKCYEADFDPFGKRYDFVPSSIIFKKIKDDDYFLWKEIRSVIKKFDPDIVGISFVTCEFYSAIKVADIVKGIDKEILVVGGGPHISALPKETLSQSKIDIAVLGEGEYTFLDLVRVFEKNNSFENLRGIAFKKDGKIQVNTVREPIKRLDYLPFPAKDLVLNVKSYPHILGTIMTNRGCYYNCTFCAAGLIHKKPVRFRNPKLVVDEIESLYEKGVIDFHFADSNFLSSSVQAMKICKEIMKRKINIRWTCLAHVNHVNKEVIKVMKKSGCYRIALGIESGNLEILRHIKKGLTIKKCFKAIKIIKDGNIMIHNYFVIGFLSETENSLNDTLKFIRDLKPTSLDISYAIPLPGTQLYNQCLKENRLIDRNWLEYTGFFPKIIPKYIPLKKLASYFQRFFRLSFSLNEKYILRRNLLLATPYITTLVKNLKFLRLFYYAQKSFNNISISRFRRNNRIG